MACLPQRLASIMKVGINHAGWCLLVAPAPGYCRGWRSKRATVCRDMQRAALTWTREQGAFQPRLRTPTWLLWGHPLVLAEAWDGSGFQCVSSPTPLDTCRLKISFFVYTR